MPDCFMQSLLEVYEWYPALRPPFPPFVCGAGTGITTVTRTVSHTLSASPLSAAAPAPPRVCCDDARPFLWLAVQVGCGVWGCWLGCAVGVTATMCCRFSFAGGLQTPVHARRCTPDGSGVPGRDKNYTIHIRGACVTLV